MRRASICKMYASVLSPTYQFEAFKAFSLILFMQA